MRFSSCASACEACLHLVRPSLFHPPLSYANVYAQHLSPHIVHLAIAPIRMGNRHTDSQGTRITQAAMGMTPGRWLYILARVLSNLKSSVKSFIETSVMSCLQQDYMHSLLLP